MEDTGERLIPEGNMQTLTYGEHLSRYMSVMNIVKDKIVLDVACGTGYGSQMIAHQAQSVLGVDRSPEAVEYARAHYPEKNLTYAVDNAMQLSLEDNSFDVVISLETIEHLVEPEEFIKEVKRVLRPGGIFVVSTPNDDEFMDDNEYHVHEFQFSELKDLIGRYFKNDTYFYQGTYFATGIFDESTFKNGLTKSSIDLSLTFGQGTNNAIYYMAIASDSDVADLQLASNVTLADKWSTKQDIERSKGYNESVQKLQQDVKNVTETANANLRAYRILEEKLANNNSHNKN